jgi:hypothetical protein
VSAAVNAERPVNSAAYVLKMRNITKAFSGVVHRLELFDVRRETHDVVGREHSGNAPFHPCVWSWSRRKT